MNRVSPLKKSSPFRGPIMLAFKQPLIIIDFSVKLTLPCQAVLSHPISCPPKTLAVHLYSPGSIESEGLKLQA